MAELNPVAKKWVAALRSGKIQQTRKQLGNKNGGRCCLGVLCDLAVEDGVIQDYYKYSGSLPRKVMRWAGLSDDMGEYKSKTSRRSLAGDNDTYNRSFAQIADIIESQPEGLFV